MKFGSIVFLEMVVARLKAFPGIGAYWPATAQLLRWRSIRGKSIK